MSAPASIPLGELQSRIKKGIAESHPLPYWVTAEIGELKVNGSSGHCYLELVEKGDTDALPRARASAVIWRHHHGMIDAYFREATGGGLSAGIRVLVKATVNYHELYGLSLQITDIEPAYTLGDLEARRRETIARLEREGILTMNRELDLPDPVQRIAVVSSPQAAGYQDFTNELSGGAQGYAYCVVLFPAVMQGQQTEESVIAALDAVAERSDEFDAVVLIRGGGAQSDLAAFNGYRLTSHLAQFPLPVLTGIGHDKDQSVSDLVAHTPLKTPTAVAAFLLDRTAAFEGRMEALHAAVISRAGSRLADARIRIGECAYLLHSLTANTMHASSRRLDSLLAELRHRSAMRLSDGKARLELLASRVEGKNPERILALGYAVVRGADGRTIRSIDGVTVGEVLTLRLQGGTAGVRVEEKKTIYTREADENLTEQPVSDDR